MPSPFSVSCRSLCRPMVLGLRFLRLHSLLRGVPLVVGQLLRVLLALLLVLTLLLALLLPVHLPARPLRRRAMVVQ